MLKLLLPVIFPSWRFFSSIGPSPRIYFAFLHDPYGDVVDWQEFRPRPAVVSFFEGVKRLFHNPEWNETLYINTCAERLFEGHSEMREQEIMHRLMAAIARNEIPVLANAQWLVFKIDAIIRDENEVSIPTVFISRPASLTLLPSNKGGNLWF